MRRGGVAMAWARFVCLVAVVLGVVSTQPQATLVRVALADSKELSARLQSIRVRVESAESDISNMKEEFNSLLAKKRELEDSLKQLKSEDKALQGKIAELKEKETILIASVEVSEQRAREQQRKVQNRLRAIYINARAAAGTLLGMSGARGDIERASLYARKVRELDSRLLQEAAQAVIALQKSREVLAQSVATEEKLRRELQQKKDDTESNIAALKVVTSELREKQRLAQESLSLLHDEAKKVEEMIAALTTGSDQLPGGEEKDTVAPGEEAEADGEPTPKSEASQPEEALIQPPPIQKTVLFPNLFDRASQATAPVKGEVLQTFGGSKKTNFAEMVRSKGIEFATSPGSDVHAVLAGRVAFVGVMPGYDQVIVLEHGDRSYSLYGRVGSATVGTGSVVEKDQIIAKTSTPDEKGRNFYFEVRRKGLPMNPKGVLVKVSR